MCVCFDKIYLLLNLHISCNYTALKLFLLLVYHCHNKKGIYGCFNTPPYSLKCTFVLKYVHLPLKYLLCFKPYFQVSSINFLVALDSIESY